MHPIRKKNRLADYDYSQPGAYFITVCTKDRKCILSTIVGADALIGPDAPTPVGADAHIGPGAPAPVGADAHIGPGAPTSVGADAHIGPGAPAPVGADAHIGPQVVLTPVGKVVEKYIQSIPGIGEFVIMPNHVHMILRISATNILEGPMWASAPTKASIPAMVRSWKILISKELGQSIWQRSYYDHIIRDEQDYLTRVQYIAENPAKWHFDDYFRW